MLSADYAYVALNAANSKHRTHHTHTHTKNYNNTTITTSTSRYPSSWLKIYKIKQRHEICRLSLGEHFMFLPAL